MTSTDARVTQPKSCVLTDTELCAGKRANFHVHYTNTENGTKYLDPSWAKTAQEAADQIVAFGAELGENCKIRFVVPIKADC